MSKLFEYRERTNLTQDELAEKSGISVRTIQRIEAGSPLKGHTLNAIAKALSVEPSELNSITSTEIDKNNYSFIKLINISSLLFFIPLCNILIPLLIINLSKEKNIITKQIVSVQIMWTISTAILFIATPFIQKWFSLNRQSILVVLMACILTNVYIIFRNAMEIDKNKKLHIKLSFNIL